LATSATLNKRLTAAEYEQLPEILGFRDELIEGERVLSPSPKLAHSVVIKRLEKLIEAQLQDLSENPLEVLRESGWFFRTENNTLDSLPVPDLMVVLRSDFEQGLRNKDWMQGKPLFVVEVISPSERRSRRMQKVGLYLEAGTESVVEVDYTKRVVRVHRADDTVGEYRVGETMAAPFRAEVAEIFSVLGQ
jgi:Uma2 family endonuclease